MNIEEVIKWLMIMKANLNSFPPEVSGVRKIEALAEAIRLIKNEQSIDKIDCDNADCNNCVNHKYCDYESNKSEIPTGSATKNDLGVREFEEIVVEYPPEDLCTYPEYKGKPYFSIKYKEGNDCFIGYGTYKPKVFSRYLRDYFMPLVTPQEPRKGHWVIKDNMWWVCSACGCQTRMMKKYNVPNFCPACGAKMVEPQESDIEKTKPCINCEDGCEEWAGCPCVYYKADSEGEE